MQEQCLKVNEGKHYDFVSQWLLLGLLFAATFLQKIAIPIGGVQIFLGVPIILGLMAYGFITRHLELKSDNLLLYLLMVGILALTQILGAHSFSIASILLLIIIHSPYAFGFKSGSILAGVQFLYFQRIMVFIALAGVTQYLAQFIIGGNIAFFLDTMPMQNIIMQGYNGTIPLTYGSNIFKSNGFFLQEPSNFSQLLAVAIIVEMVYFKNWKRIILFLGAIALTFSGTGLIILFALVPIYLVQRRKLLILGVLLLGVITAPIWAPIVGIEGTVNRAGEVTDTRSSGYARFVSIIPTLNTYITPNVNTFLFGLGAGSISDTLSSTIVDYERHNPSWGKMIFEYGIIGAMAYFIFIIFTFWKGSGSTYIKIALLIQLMILGEYILPPVLHSLILALLIWPVHFTYSNDYYKRGRAFWLKIK